jgi:hypothetical protein
MKKTIQEIQDSLNYYFTELDKFKNSIESMDNMFKSHHNKREEMNIDDIRRLNLRLNFNKVYDFKTNHDNYRIKQEN